jgi:hypothetical protein
VVLSTNGAGVLKIGITIKYNLIPQISNFEII